MAIVIGNKTNSNQNPNSSTQTLSHNQNVGTNGGLLVVITMASTVNFSSATYAGVAMTLVRNSLDSSEGQRVAAYYIANPNTGPNNIVINFTGTQFNFTSIFAVSFTGVDGVDTSAYTTSSSTPNSQSLTILSNSIIYASGISTQAQNTQYSIGGTSRTFEFNHSSSSKFVRGALSATGLSAGSTNVTTRADFSSVSNFRIAIKEAVPPPTLSVSPSTLSGFTYIQGSGPSSEQSFVVTGQDLTSNTTISAPTNYEISKTSGGPFSSSIIETGTSFSYSVYVILKSGLSSGTYNGEIINITSTGATSQTVTLDGEVTSLPSGKNEGSFWLIFK